MPKHTRIGAKAVLRIGGALMLLPDESIASVLERRRLTASDLIDSLPAARERVFARRYPGLAP
jgi:hypothetical protein